MCKSIVLLLGIAAVTSLSAQTNRVALAGHLRPGIVSAADLGRVDASLTLRHLTLVLQRSPAQDADLTNFLADLQDPSSPDFHHWLTPEQYGARFGASDAAIAEARSWLAGQGLTVDSVGRGRSMIAFSGNVRNIETAFQTEIHNYRVNGENHFSNATEPSVPAALRGIIDVVRGLDDFRLKPRAMKAAYTSSTSGNHYLAPGDVSTIFDIGPLYNSGITGKGQTIAVVGQTQINLSDIEQFRTYFNLSANDPQLVEVPNTKNPGVSSNDLPEADLDVEWTGAIARDATIIFVYSDNVTTSLEYAIDQNLAPVISMSYGSCESLSGSASLNALNSLAVQANAQGITWVNAAGDDGANDCYGESKNAPSGLSVDAPASVPGVTGIGGTTLTEGSASYWNSSNDANHASALSYIPESVWNDSVADGTPSSGGGGASMFFTKPSWQTGTGVPADGWRDVPDISLPASADHDGYLVYSSGTEQVYGGTSVGAPVFAGMAALLNQYSIANGFQSTIGQGNMNPRLYALAASAPDAFHDTIAGNNMVESCAPTARNCTSSTLVGFNAGVGYDQASGLGSIDAFNLVTAWHQSGSATTGAMVINGVTSAASFQKAFAPGMVISLFGQNLATGIPTLPSSPLPLLLGGVTVTLNGVSAPLYYVSPTQINVQIPYSIAANSTATVKVSANGQSATSQIAVEAHAPEVFADTASLLVPYQTTGRGQTIFLFATGDGLFTSPQVTTGSTPTGTVTAATSTTLITVGGVAAATTYVGEPSWSIGVSQVNFTIPPNAPLGRQPVVMTIGGVSSAPVYITVTQ